MIQKLMFAFVTLIIGLVLIGSISTSTTGVTSLIRTSSEVHNVASPITLGRSIGSINETITYTLTNAPTGWKTTDCPITGFALTNLSGTSFTTVLNAAAGTYTITNSTAALAALPVETNNTYATYLYCPDDYVSSWGGTILDLIPGFFALAILIFSVGMFYSVARETGIL